MVDKIYAMSSFLQFREVFGNRVKFSDKLGFPKKSNINKTETTKVKSPQDLFDFFSNFAPKWTEGGKTALLLSGGMDSAVLSKFMPDGSTAYTLKCIVPGRTTIDETIRAASYCEKNSLNHKIVEIYWEDYERYTPLLMRNKNAPIHSIEVQLYKAALQAKKDGFEKLLVGDFADIVFGGLDGFLKVDYTLGDFIDRFAYVRPYKVLKNSVIIIEPYQRHCKNGFVNGHGYVNDVFSNESANSYINACESADMYVIDAYLPLDYDIDINEIRKGESKPLMRKAFKMLYPDLELPEKIPLPRPMNEWLENWEGPKRPEFWPNCHVNMTGDQKYYIWVLERFLDEMGIE